MVIFARPDLLWEVPITPWCQHELGSVQTCLEAACDAMWVAPRAHASYLLSQAEEHRDCASLKTVPFYAQNKKRAHLFHVGCCTDSERLLWWTLQARQLPARFTLSPPGSRAGVHVLRYVDGVCETIFDARYTRWPFATKKVEEGLPYETGVALRAFFTRSANVSDWSNATKSECRAALGASQSPVAWRRHG